MKKIPAMPLWVDDYRADTRKLTLEEHGAYLLLLMEMWSNGASLDDDEESLRRVLGVSRRTMLRLMLVLSPMLERSGGKISSKRLQRVHNFCVENIRKHSERGKVGAAKRWQNVKEIQAIADARANSTSNSTSNAKAMPGAIARAMAYGNSKGNSILRKKDKILSSLPLAAREGAAPKGAPAHGVGIAIEHPQQSDSGNDLGEIFDNSGEKGYLLETDFMRKAKP